MPKPVKMSERTYFVLSRLIQDRMMELEEVDEGSKEYAELDEAQAEVDKMFWRN